MTELPTCKTCRYRSLTAQDGDWARCDGVSPGEHKTRARIGMQLRGGSLWSRAGRKACEYYEQRNEE